MKRLALIGGIVLAAAASVGPVLAYDVCTPTVNIVYYGATAPNPTINQTALNLYGTPLSTCSTDIKTYQALRDLNGDGTKETCVRMFVASSLGSCEGDEALDRKENNFNVCSPVVGSTTQVLASSINDELGSPLYCNFAGSDVGVNECTPVIQGCTLTRPAIFTDTESRPFVSPFVAIVNNSIRNYLREGEGKETLSAAQCPYGANKCVDLKFGLSQFSGKSLWGNDTLCDWRDVSPMVHSATGVAIQSLMRNAKSGTRRNFNVTYLQNLNAAPGNWYTTGSGNMVTRIQNNQGCINPPSPVPSGEGCGETQTATCGVFTYGAGIDNCRSVSLTNYASVGYIGVDRLTISDHGTPANPFDDVPIRNTDSANYDVLRFDGIDFNKANAECGFYEYWSVERLYYDNEYHAPGTFREKAIQEFITGTGTAASTDPAVIAASQMFVSRAQDGEPIYPLGPHNSFCTIP